MRRTPRGARSTGAKKGVVRRGRSSSESGGRAVVSAPPALGKKEQSSGDFQSPAAENPLGGVSAAPSGFSASGTWRGRLRGVF